MIVALLQLPLIAAIIVTLVLRRALPYLGRAQQRRVNVFLLIFFPFGTAIGIYGLAESGQGVTVYRSVIDFGSCRAT